VLTDEVGGLSAAEADLALDHLCRLFAVYAGGQVRDAEQVGPALAAARLAQVRRYIARHLGDPDLTPASVAAAHRISVRSLHLLFEPTGVSFARHVLERRLLECHAMLTSLAHAHRSVTDIAFACGFNSLSAFYRAFQGGFGAAPGDLRGAPRVMTEGGLAGGLAHAGKQKAG
jgi:transcriptional regulator GlxA family with amidase domain